MSESGPQVQREWDQSQGLRSMTPATDLALRHTAVHIEAAANFQLACAALQAWIVARDLKQEQLVGISAMETVTDDGEAVLSVVYKTLVDVTATSLKDLKFTLVSNVKSWEEQYNTAIADINDSKSEIVALTHTAKCLGKINIQIFWYVPRGAHEFSGYSLTKHVSTGNY